MSLAEFEAATSHELAPTVMDPAWFMCRFCGKTFDMATLYRLLPQDVLAAEECDMSEMFFKKTTRTEKKTCTCGIGSKWEVGHSRYCDLSKK